MIEEMVKDLEWVARWGDADVAYSARGLLGALRSGEISWEGAEEWHAKILECLGEGND